MIIKNNYLLLIASLLLLSGCARTHNASLSTRPPADVMVAPSDVSMLETMTKALDGARGLRSDWLYDYAGEVEQYRLQLIACQNFIKKERE